MTRGGWNPLRLLTWYGYCISAAWGLPAQTPRDNVIERELARFRACDVDKAVRRLIAQERR